MEFLPSFFSLSSLEHNLNQLNARLWAVDKGSGCPGETQKQRTMRTCDEPPNRGSWSTYHGTKMGIAVSDASVEDVVHFGQSCCTG